MTISRRSNAPPSRTGAVGHWENQRACMPPGETQLIGCPKDEVLPRSYLKGVLRVNGSDSAGILARMSNPPSPFAALRVTEGSVRHGRFHRLCQLFLRSQGNNRAIQSERHHFDHRLDEVELHL